MNRPVYVEAAGEPARPPANPMVPKIVAGVFGAIVVIALIVLSAKSRNSGPEGFNFPGMASMGADSEGVPPVTLAEMNLVDMSGAPTTLSAFEGKPMVVDFWATWCGPCIQQRSELMKLEAMMGDSIYIASVSVDDDLAVARSFVEKHGEGFAEFYFTPETTDKLGGIRAIPTLVLFDANGVARERYTGVMSFGFLRERLEALR